MKVLQIISSTGYYGAENVMVQLSTVLNGIEDCSMISGVILNTDNPHAEVINESKKKNVETALFQCNGKYDLKTIYKIRKFVIQNKIDIIHSHGYKANIYAYLSTIGLKIGLIATCHNWLGKEAKMVLYAMLDRIILKRFDHVAAVSFEIHEKLERSKITTNKLSVVRNGIDLKRLEAAKGKKAIKKKLKIPVDSLVIGTVGRISEEKGHVYLLNAAKALLQKYAYLTFLIVGEGDLKEELEDRFENPNIIFTGHRKDMPDIYKCMDVFVLASITEGLPMVLLEAMASKLPVIATKVGYIPFVVLKNVTGILIEPEDEKGLVSAITQMIENKDIRENYGNSGYLRVKEQFSASQMANAYLNIYKQIVHQE